MVTKTKPTITTPPKEKKDWLPPVAITLGAVGAGVGLYLFMKKAPKEVKEGEWAEAGVILARKTFQVTVTTEEAGWKPAGQELARKPFQVTITEVAPGAWLPAHTELDRKSFTVTITEVVPGGWLPAYAELDRKPFTVTITEVVLEYYTVEVASDPIWGGWVVQEPDKDKYVYGEIVKLTAKEIWPYKFWYWDFNGEWLTTANPINFLVTRDGTVTAHFRL